MPVHLQSTGFVFLHSYNFKPSSCAGYGPWKMHRRLQRQMDCRKNILMPFMAGQSRYRAAPEVLCASRQTHPTLLAVPVFCPRTALLNTQSTGAGTSKHPLGCSPVGVVQTQHGEKVLFCPSRKTDICNWQRTVLHLLGVKSTWLGCYQRAS